MATVSANITSPQVVVCGSGRIGGQLQQLLGSYQVPFMTARLDSQQGLYNAQAPLPTRFKVLVICISAGHKTNARRKPWQWDQILRGLVAQIESQQLQIESLVLVSSSRVFEAIECGIVTAATRPRANSAQGQALISAEQQLLSCQTNTVILNCSGLYGRDYSRYTPILLAAEDKPRFGIDAAEVAYLLAQLVSQGLASSLTSQRHLLTDGRTYYRHRQLNYADDKAAVEALAGRYRVLINSKVNL